LGNGNGNNAVVKVNGTEVDSTKDVQKEITFNMNSGETMEIVGSSLLYYLEFS
jgi:ABC-type microcin C transport system duplicated ATPase subunit YejF